MLQGKTALVTGCNRGIGKAIIEKFAKDGANLITVTRKPSTEFDDFLKTNDIEYAEDAKDTLINLMSHFHSKLVNKICITLRDVIGNLKSCYESNGKRYYAFDYLPEKCKNLIDELERLWKDVSKKENNAISKSRANEIYQRNCGPNRRCIN